MAPQAGVNGVLPASVLQKNPPPSAPRGPKAPSPRLKLVLRRLPPGLTKNEFETILGDEWKFGAGKVDWLNFKKGKISKDLAKPSRPARAYIHVTSQALVPVLGDHVRQLNFQDAAKSTQDNALVGPPTLEFAPFHKLPTGKKKQDNRQGTIDQDPEFQAFLESLTNPITKPAAAEGEDRKEERITTTPLIEALREKKANKEKPSSKSGKHARGEPKEESEKKILSKQGKDSSNPSAEKSRRATKAEKAAAAKEAVKVLNKEAASKEPSSEKAAPSPAPERKRGNASLAKSIIQRDLGGGSGPSRRRGTKRETTAASQETPPPTPGDAPTGKQKGKESAASNAPAAASSTEKASSATPKKERPSRAERRAFKASLADKTNAKNTTEKADTQGKATPTPAPTILKKPQATPSPAAPKGPAATRGPPTEPAASRGTNAKVDATSRPQAVTTASQASPAPTTRQAFLKHANPSQGITEPLIEEALKVFGVIEKVEIDKRKGFAYVDFAEPGGLQKAISASPVKVAQGAVQVLERKEKVARAPPVGPARGGRGGFPGRGRGRGGARGGHTAAAAPSTAAPTPTATPAT